MYAIRSDYEILVRDGTKVKAGQTLIVLKDVRVDAGKEAVRTQLDAELAKAVITSYSIHYTKLYDRPAAFAGVRR